MGVRDVGILGFGKMPADCAQILLDHHVPVSFVLETEESRFSSLEALCGRRRLRFRKTSRSETAAFLNDLTDPTVVFSANNNFIFPARVVGKKNLRIINFHNAVLPSYRGHGQAIPQWIVYNEEKRHGVTWHLVNDQIDAGNILCQDIFDVAAGDTALSVMVRSMKTGSALFAKWWDSFLDPGYHGMAQEGSRRIYRSPMQDRLYRKTDLPNKGYLDLSWGFQPSLRFLRSMDYGPLQLIDPARVLLDGQEYAIKKYKVKDGPSNRKGQGGVGKRDGGERIHRLRFDEGVIALHLQG